MVESGTKNDTDLGICNSSYFTNSESLQNVNKSAECLQSSSLSNLCMEEAQILTVIPKHCFERRGSLVTGFDMNINPKSYFVLYWYCHVYV